MKYKELKTKENPFIIPALVIVGSVIAGYFFVYKPVREMFGGQKKIGKLIPPLGIAAVAQLMKKQFSSKTQKVINYGSIGLIGYAGVMAMLPEEEAKGTRTGKDTFEQPGVVRVTLEEPAKGVYLLTRPTFYFIIENLSEKTQTFYWTLEVEGRGRPTGNVTLNPGDGKRVSESERIGLFTGSGRYRVHIALTPGGKAVLVTDWWTFG